MRPFSRGLRHRLQSVFFEPDFIMRGASRKDEETASTTLLKTQWTWEESGPMPSAGSALCSIEEPRAEGHRDIDQARDEFRRVIEILLIRFLDGFVFFQELRLHRFVHALQRFGDQIHIVPDITFSVFRQHGVRIIAGHFLGNLPSQCPPDFHGRWDTSVREMSGRCQGCYKFVNKYWVWTF